MIRNLADLLHNLADAEAKKLDDLHITHAPTIGKMYEGLTTEILARTLPPACSLSVVNGFACDGLGNRSGQIDCMLVRGNGIQIPYTDSYEWHVKDVIAVVEVKKNLFSKDLSDAYDQMKSVSTVYSSWLSSVTSDDGQVNLLPTERAFAEITGRFAPPVADLGRFKRSDHLIFHTLMFDQLAPIRIILGYTGFRSERGLRKGFLRYLKSRVGQQGFGPSNLPQLIICGNSCLVKLSGHPYRARLIDGRIPILGSASSNPTLFLLEFIWTRLSYDYEMSSLFGEDLSLETLKSFIQAEPCEIPGNPGNWAWNYIFRELSGADLQAAPIESDWNPAELNFSQFTIINVLTRVDDHKLHIDDVRSYAESEKINPDELVSSLIDTALVAIRGDFIELTTKMCGCIILPGPKYVAAENNTGRLTRWINKNYKDVLQVIAV